METLTNKGSTMNNIDDQIQHDILKRLDKIETDILKRNSYNAADVAIIRNLVHLIGMNHETEAYQDLSYKTHQLIKDHKTQLNNTANY